ncbi:hypothetical protein AB0H82_10425 [Streptomyces sp. NPDC050732]|uniref:hypothetical protein n=1 Tax=Streptomyces sp. NPDC050732 TaxID=3154632 RepID=UPI003419B87D
MLLSYEQVRAYELPATEGKHGDPRWSAFARRYGFGPACPVQWEAEALKPAELQRLVLAAVAPYVDRDVLARQVAVSVDQVREDAVVPCRCQSSGHGHFQPSSTAIIWSSGSTHMVCHVRIL